MDHQLSLPFQVDSEVMYKLGSIEAQLVALNAKLDKKEADQDRQLNELHARVGVLESTRVRNEAYRLGAAAVIAFIVGILAKVVEWPNLF
jgi:hypothetical protein